MSIVSFDLTENGLSVKGNHYAITKNKARNILYKRKSTFNSMLIICIGRKNWDQKYKLIIRCAYC